MANLFSGTATVAVSGLTATITNVADDTVGGFASLTTGSIISCNGGFGFVATNTGTVITATGWGGAASTTAVIWKGQPVSDSATYAATALALMSALNDQNTLPSGRALKTTARETLLAMDGICSCYLTSMAVTAPPSAPVTGAAYYVPTGATGDWAGYAGKIAYYIDGVWKYYAPFNGLTAYNAADGKYYLYLSSAWSVLWNSALTLPSSGTLASLSVAQTWSAAQTFAAMYGTSLNIGTTTVASALTVSGAATVFTDGNSNAFIATAAAAYYYGVGIILHAGNISGHQWNIWASGSGDAFGGGTLQFIDKTAGLVRWVMDASGNFQPGQDAAYSLGTSVRRVSQLYAATPTISTSWSELKTNVRVLSDAEISCAKDLAGLICLYQFKDAVTAKGADAARLHTGLIADTNSTITAVEAVQTIFAKYSLDPLRYGLFCRDVAQTEVTKTRTVSVQKTESKTRTVEKIIVTDGKAVLTTVEESYDAPVFETLAVVDATGAAVLDGNGIARTYQNPVMIDQSEDYTEMADTTNDDGSTKYAYSLRYEELLAFIAAGLAARLTALETAATSTTSATSSSAS